MDYPCDKCRYGEYDEEYEEFCCTMLWDEDAAARHAQGCSKQCPYFYPEDDYDLVRRQK